jgi:hypothetical protein
MYINGGIAFKNKDDRKRKYFNLRMEFGEKIRIWREGNVLFYEGRVNPKSMYM